MQKVKKKTFFFPEGILELNDNSDKDSRFELIT